MSTTFQVTFDAEDPARLAAFWSGALGYIEQPPPPDFDSWEDWARAMDIPEENWNDAAALVDPDESGPRIFIQRVPEEKSAKNRVHLDLNISGGGGTPPDVRRSKIDAEVERLTGIGAIRIEAIDQRNEYWVVMNDPEGNEFCVH